MMTFTFSDSRLPIVPVRISISDALGRALDRMMDPRPDPVTINALVDSGASLTVIRPCVVEKLRLRQKGTCKIGGLSESASLYPNFDASLAILDGSEEGNEIFRISDMQVVGAPLSTPGIEMLIGMDVLEHFEFTINARLGTLKMIQLPPVAESEVA